jgi:hypothetical protein
LDGEMPGHRRLARPALLGSDSNNMHFYRSPSSGPVGPESGHQRTDRTLIPPGSGEVSAGIFGIDA